MERKINILAREMARLCEIATATADLMYPRSWDKQWKSAYDMKLRTLVLGFFAP